MEISNTVSFYIDYVPFLFWKKYVLFNTFLKKAFAEKRLVRSSEIEIFIRRELNFPFKLNNLLFVFVVELKIRL